MLSKSGEEMGLSSRLNRVGIGMGICGMQNGLQMWNVIMWASFFLGPWAAKDTHLHPLRTRKTA